MAPKAAQRVGRSQSAQQAQRQTAAAGGVLRRFRMQIPNVNM